MDIRKLIDDPSEFANFNIKENIDELSEVIMLHLHKSIEKLSNKVASKITTGNNLNLPKKAFMFMVKDKVKKGIESYYRNEKWKNGAPIYPYIMKILNIYASNIILNQNIDNAIVKKDFCFVCPVCRIYGMTEYLELVNDKLLCSNCVNVLSALKNDLNYCNNYLVSFLKNKINLVSAFINHSINGVSCNKCNKFIPNSYDKIECPYVNCNGIKSEIQKQHPIVYKRTSLLYANSNIKNDVGSGRNIEHIDMFCASTKDPYALLSTEETNLNKFLLVKNTIIFQKKNIYGVKKIPIKECMYDAFYKTLIKYPEELIEYIVDGGWVDIAIQPIIIQYFIDELASRLPILFFKDGIEVRISSILDSRLKGVNDVKCFYGFVDDSFIINRKNQFRVVNNKLISDDSDCFIGKIISILDNNNSDISNYIENYSFSAIKFSNENLALKGCEVKVKYYSIPSKYVDGIMMYLQRIKKKLSDSVRNKIQND